MTREQIDGLVADIDGRLQVHGDGATGEVLGQVKAAIKTLRPMVPPTRGEALDAAELEALADYAVWLHAQIQLVEARYLEVRDALASAEIATLTAVEG